MTRVDYLVVGSGLTGATIARILADAGKSVLAVERRRHLGGNVADEVHLSGIRIHKYGPHYFRTSSERIWGFVNRFATFHPYAAVVRSRVDGRLENWPIAASYVRRVIGEQWEPEFRGTPSNFEEAALSMMPRRIYEQFVKGYSEKQWGVPAHTLAASLCRRFDVRADDNPLLTPRAKYQGIPTEGYSRMMERMLGGVPVLRGYDYLKNRDRFKARRMAIYTGPIDEYFGFSLGRLAYRGQLRDMVYLPDNGFVLPCGQVNEPDPETPYVRTIEWKHMMPSDHAKRICGTVITKERAFSPTDPDQYEYPFPDDANRQLYWRYRRMAEEEEGVLFCGRLGEYRYYDMDQAIGRAMVLARRILEAG